MRIGVNTRILLKGKMEGMPVFTAEVLKRMVTAHPEHEFFFFFDRPFDQSFIFGENVTPIEIFPQARHPFLFIWWFEWSLVGALKKHKIDIFLSPDNFCSLRTEVPTLLVVHDIAYKHFPDQVTGIHKWYYNRFMPQFIEKAEQIVTVSDFTKKDIVEKMSALPEKIAVACNGCNEKFKPISHNEKIQIREKFTEGISYFLFVGLIHPRKNVHRLIRAFSRFKEETEAKEKLVLVGRNGWMTEEVKTALENSNYKKDVIFTGFVEHEELPKLIAAAEALMYVSLFEGFGIPILEAFHCETPVITSNTSSMPEVGGDAALYADPESVDSIAEQMKLLYEHPKLKDELVKKGKAQRTKFSWEKASKVVYENIELIARKNGVI